MMTTRCRVCGRADLAVSRGVGACRRCLFEESAAALSVALKSHRANRVGDGLVPEPPHVREGVKCSFCGNECQIPEGQAGFCGLRRNEGGKLVGGVSEGNFSWYHDPLPTNCVADWVCPAGTGTGYPQYAHRKGPEHGYKNLAVFSQVCSYDCAFCQNGSYRALTRRPTWHTAENLVGAVDLRTSCICYFGGDPGPQMPVFLKASRMARRQRGSGILRICWETNGSFHPSFLDAALKLSLESGGCVKFDLKAVTPALHKALTGMENEQTLKNFARAAARIPERPDPPPLIASTLLVPGYIEAEEVNRIAAFIAELDPSIPYSLLAFAPHLFMQDLPPTSRAQAEACYGTALGAGLTRVRIGNIHLLR